MNSGTRGCIVSPEIKEEIKPFVIASEPKDRLSQLSGKSNGFIKRKVDRKSIGSIFTGRIGKYRWIALRKQGIVLKQLMIEASAFIKNCNKRVARYILSGAGVIIALSCATARLDLAYDMYLNNHYIGVISNKTVFEQRVDEINEEIKNSGYDIPPVEGEIESFLRLVPKGQFTDGEEINSNIKLAGGQMTVASVLKLDGQDTLAMRSGEDIKVLVEEVSTAYVTQETVGQPVIINEVEIIEEVVPYANIKSEEQSRRVLEENLKISTVEEQNVVETVAFETKKIEDDQIYEGISEVVTYGESGKKDIVFTVAKVNGEEISKRAIKEEVLEETEAQVVKVGTKKRVPGVGLGTIIRPYYGGVSSRFGARWGRQHKGVDFGGRIGDPVVAADSGVVTHAGTMSGFGKLVIIDHKNGYKTYYAHLSAFSVSVGQIVEQGERIASVGNTGNSTGPHLHFEVHKNGSPIDPLTVIGK